MPRVLIREEPQFLPSGSYCLDLALGGGWGKGRVINIVGDKSTGKTLLAIEACAQFALTHGKERIRYAEAESAFDEEYAETLGMPPGIDYVRGLDTVEAWYENISEWLVSNKSNQPCLYILDSLDALSDAAEMERDMEKGSYGGEKAKKLSQLFRRLIRDMGNSNCTLIIISQIRDKMNVMFGETKTRSGGRALDFYASQIVWLAEVFKVKVSVRGMDRIIGIEVRAKVKKNKVGVPYREADFIIRFGYGIDDETSLANFLKDAKVLDGKKEFPETIAAIKEARLLKDRKALNRIGADLRAKALEVWTEIEEHVAVPIRKYE